MAFAIVKFSTTPSLKIWLRDHEVVGLLHVAVKLLLPSQMIQVNLPLLEKQAFYFWITFFNYFNFPAFSPSVLAVPLSKSHCGHTDEGHLSKKICSPMYTVEPFIMENLLMCMGCYFNRFYCFFL